MDRLTYKQVMRYNKTLGKRSPLLINMLINIKSHYHPRFVYREKETRCQLMLIKNGQKSWSGDVLSFFKKKCDYKLWSEPFICRPYKGEKTYIKNGVPFSDDPDCDLPF